MEEKVEKVEKEVKTQVKKIKPRGKKRILIGEVTSNKAAKTISVDVQRKVPHKLYKKYIKKTSRLYAHDEKEQAHIGDKVQIMETRPLSKNKNWRLVKILKH